MEGPSPPQRPRPSRVRRRRTKRIVLATLAGVVTAVVLLGIDAAIALRSTTRELLASRQALVDVGVAVAGGDQNGVKIHAEEAAIAADATLAAVQRPSMRLASLLPVVGDNVRAIEAVAIASRGAAEAGANVADGMAALEWTDLLLPAAAATGDLDLSRIREAIPSFSQVVRDLEDAKRALDDADTGWLIGPAAAAYEDARTTLARRTAIARDARDVLRLSTFLAGGNGPRRYLIAVQTLGLPQGTGGMIELAGVVSARAGHLRLSTPLEPSSAFVQANLSPDRRVSGEAIMQAAQDNGLGELDGVIVVDSVWLQDVCYLVDAVRTDAWPVRLTLDNTADVLEREVYLTQDRGAAERRRGEMATAIVQALLRRRPGAWTFSVAMAQSVGEQHLWLYSTHDREASLLRSLGMGGPPPRTRGTPLAVIWERTLENHVAVFAQRSINYSITLEQDRSARVRTVVGLENRSESYPSSVLLGMSGGPVADRSPVGAWNAVVRLPLHDDAEQPGAEISIPGETSVEQYEGGRALTATLETRAGQQISLLATYVVPKASKDGTYLITLLPQASLIPPRVQVRITAPQGTTFSSGSLGIRLEGTLASYEGVLRRPVELSVHFG